MPDRSGPVRVPEGSAARALQLHMVVAQVQRTPYAVFAADALLAWLLERDGLTDWAWTWLLAATATSFGRAYAARRLVKRSDTTDRALGHLTLWFFLVGSMRCWPILIAFQGSIQEVWFLVTLVMVVLAAGCVGISAGVVQLYLAWAAPVALTLAGTWLHLPDFESAWIAVLVLLMFLLLTLYVRDDGKMLASQIDLVEKLRAERDRADAERNRAQAERRHAESAALAKSRFFAAASHDLRQPLGVLRWYGDAVTTHARRIDHEALLAIGEGIGRALERVEPLVRRYLDVAKIDSGAVEVSPRPCNVAVLLEKVRDAFAREAEELGLSLRTEFRSAVATLVVISDESILRSILDNFVGNALKFTSVGGVTLGAGLIERISGSVVRVWVSDTGMGIPEDEQRNVFEDFYQLDNPERRHSKGVGLGLGIARRQAQLLGIELHLTSRVGVGSTFEFELPSEATDLQTELEIGAASAATTKGLHVLVIDDEPEVRLSLRIMLEAVDCEVRTASGLSSAFGEFERGFRPDALIVDHRLDGDTTGGEVVAELRASGWSVPAVIVTGDTAPERLAMLRSTGLPVLQKPIQGEHLITALLGAIASQGLNGLPPPEPRKDRT
jgi:two-component system, sensor histidine kinase